MKYFVETDERDYVLMIRHTGRVDFVELDLSKYDFSDGKIRAYKLGKNELIFDEEEWNRILTERQEIQDRKEIADLEQKLKDTDYIIAKWGEEIVALENPLTWVTDVIKINVKYLKEYKETFKDRKTWRERIEELKQ